MENKECEFKPKCFYASKYCGTIKNVCVHREKLIELTQVGDQYTAVVAQNKSLQGELLLTKKIIELLINSFKIHTMACDKCKGECDMCKAVTLSNFTDKALQELEAENE